MPAVGELTPRSRMDERARTGPGHIFLRFEDRDYTFGQVDAAVNRIANGLLAQGMVPGAGVAVLIAARGHDGFPLQR